MIRGPKQLVIQFNQAWGQRAYWRLKLICGHKMKIPVQDGQKWPPGMVHCKSCWYKEQAEKKRGSSNE